MNRRQLVAGLLAAGTATAAGCAGDEEWTPEIDGDSATLSPGEEAIVTVHATDGGGFGFQPPPDGISIRTDAPERDVSPPPDSGADSYPPRWFWSSRTDVAVEVPIAAADTAAPGEYQYGVTVVPGADSEQAVHEEFGLTATEG